MVARVNEDAGIVLVDEDGCFSENGDANRCCPSCSADILGNDPHNEECDSEDHVNHKCSINCKCCEAEVDADEAPGGQCYENVCCHDDCIDSRSST